jgi:hypothetical protein
MYKYHKNLSYSSASGCANLSGGKEEALLSLDAAVPSFSSVRDGPLGWESNLGALEYEVQMVATIPRLWIIG